MSGIIDNLFNFRSKEEKARNYESYSKRIFPYGDTQKERISDLLTALFPELNPKHVLMYYILIKEGMTEETPLEFETAAAKIAKYSLVRITPELKAGVQALLNIDLSINEELKYPSSEELRAASTNILSSGSSL
jgi:hypothetical protein